MKKITFEYASESKWMAPIKFTGDCLKRLRSAPMHSERPPKPAAEPFGLQRGGAVLRAGFPA